MGTGFQTPNVLTLSETQKRELANTLHIDPKGSSYLLTQRIMETLNGTVCEAKKRLSQKQEEYQVAKNQYNNISEAKYYAEKNYNSMKYNCGNGQDPKLLAAKTKFDITKSNFADINITTSVLLGSVQSANQYVGKISFSCLI